MSKKRGSSCANRGTCELYGNNYPGCPAYPVINLIAVGKKIKVIKMYKVY